MMLLYYPYLFNTNSFSGLTPVRIRKAGANLRTFKPFLRVQLLIMIFSCITFLCLLGLNVGVEPSAQHTAPWRFAYFTCFFKPRFHFLVDASVVFDVTKQELLLKIKTTCASLSVATQAWTVSHSSRYETPSVLMLGLHFYCYRIWPELV